MQAWLLSDICDKPMTVCCSISYMGKGDVVSEIRKPCPLYLMYISTAVRCQDSWTFRVCLKTIIESLCSTASSLSSSSVSLHEEYEGLVMKYYYISGDKDVCMNGPTLQHS